jgi:hypothetical protein
MTFQRTMIGLFVLAVAGLAGSFYMNWKTLAQPRTMKAFTEGYCLRRSCRGLREGAKLHPVQMEYRDQDRSYRIELGQARQTQDKRELHAGRG